MEQKPADIPSLLPLTSKFRMTPNGVCISSVKLIVQQTTEICAKDFTAVIQHDVRTNKQASTRMVQNEVREEEPEFTDKEGRSTRRLYLSRHRHCLRRSSPVKRG
jgi:hypothetical protein